MDWSGPEVITLFMLNLAERENFSTNKDENANNGIFYLLAKKLSFSAVFNRKEFAIVSNFEMS